MTDGMSTMRMECELEGVQGVWSVKWMEVEIEGV